MRVTSETRDATRHEILAAARGLFASHGFEATTTREISRQAKVAAGTLFNYFPSKEAIVACLAREALAKARKEFALRCAETESLEEALFAHAAAGLRKLKPLRKLLAATLDAVLCPTLTAPASEHADAIRTEHMETVARIVAQRGADDGVSGHALQLYWTLFTGVVAFWASDASPKQEDTLALLDESIEMFVAWLIRK